MLTIKEQLLSNSKEHNSLTQIRVNGKAFLTLSSQDIGFVINSYVISSFILNSKDYNTHLIGPTFEHVKSIHVINIKL